MRQSLLAISLLFAGGAAYALTRPTGVTASRVVDGSVIHAVYATGTIEPVERVELRARVSGVVGNVVAREGDTVAAGSLIAKIESTALGFVELRAPVDGTILANRIRSGEYVGIHQALFRIGNPERLQVEAQIDVADVARVSEGMEAIVQLHSKPGESFAGHVERIVPDRGRIRKSFQIILSLDSPPNGLRPGMTAEASVIVERHDHVALAPISALRDNAIWIIDSDGKAHCKKIQIGIRDRKSAEVTGLAIGDLVVTSETSKLRENERVNALVVEH